MEFDGTQELVVPEAIHQKDSHTSNAMTANRKRYGNDVIEDVDLPAEAKCQRARCEQRRPRRLAFSEDS